MYVRGAPLIGATAAWSLYLAALTGGAAEVQKAATALLASRPTAVNLRWAVERVLAACTDTNVDIVQQTRNEAESICDEDYQDQRRNRCRHGLTLIESVAGEEKRCARQRSDALQCRVVGDDQLGHGNGADLFCASGRYRRTRLGRRNAPAQPGFATDGLGAGSEQRTAHTHCR